MEVQTVFVRQRPYLHMFLEAVASMFDVVIFTAGQSIYAGQLLDILDPNQTLIGQRVYRDSCVFADGEYLKDLTILGRDLARIAIVDNTPQVYLFLSYINYISVFLYQCFPRYIIFMHLVAIHTKICKCLLLCINLTTLNVFQRLLRHDDALRTYMVRTPFFTLYQRCASAHTRFTFLSAFFWICFAMIPYSFPINL